MAKTVQKLSPYAIKSANKKGLYHDGAGLYLQVSATGVKSWLFRYTRHGRASAMGLGSINVIGLAEARVKAAGYRKQLLDGIDPLENRKVDQTKAQLEAAKSRTFKQCAEEVIKDLTPTWKNQKHAWQWTHSFTKHVFPHIGTLSVQAIDLPLVLKVLKPIWATRTETATRVRARIETVLNWATVRGYRKGENPARWKGHLDSQLPAPNKIRKIKHYPALPYQEISEFMTQLEKHPGTAAQALKLLILTTVRSNEVRGLTWQELDMELGIWTIPAERMKAGIEHRIPLSKQALEHLRRLRCIHQKAKNPLPTDFVFPGQKTHKPLSDMAINMLLKKRMKQLTITAHGFRSSFRDWAAEMTNYPGEVAEAALAHLNKDKVEAAYLHCFLL